MFGQESLLKGRPQECCGPGAVLQRRGVFAQEVIFVDSGVVGLGVAGAQELEHCLGLAQGPCWLEPSAAILGLAPVMDAMAQSSTLLRRIPLADFRQALGGCSPGVHSMVCDMARLHLQQTEVAVGRLVKDAEGRCAQWLLQHAKGAADGHVVVEFQDRKRQVAQILGIAPETLSRIFKLLRERGLIAGTGKVVELVDLPALNQLAGV
ncbi:Crp/Fnr family transcriptional regulator [Curvibacter sp. APW13]|uniref:Crp/Fnr family transcriptional regulator n=1 Tax=Curvibacter sp. APW13 TaxID=3077236 RepID=UPI0028E07F81|nr:Crp/Fnr family transcriptional regulator [Curvibacter sp. APW13]MDT8991096.1 Crp/Fnr family transcriptional regulator [Curvibacter sp. APW13]